MRKTAKAIRKLVIGLVGFPLLAAGIVLIPLPGPGVLISFIALFVLSFEFDWANRYFAKTKTMLAKVVKDAKARQERINKRLGD